MSGAILSTKDAIAAASALKAWFKSQQMEPCDAIMTCETFFAAMIVENSTGLKDDKAKIELLVDTINAFISMFRRLRTQ